MLRLLLASVSALALASVPASAQTMADIDAIDLSGQTITVFSVWLTADEESFLAVLKPFEEATGAKVSYVGANNFEQQIIIDVEGNSPPDIAIFPQPGLAADIAGRGGLVPLGDETGQWIEDNYAAGKSWRDLGTFAGPAGKAETYGLFFKVDVKSLVWYAPDNFADAGYAVPQTMEELMALSAKMVADGHAPWCIGLGSGSATGWPATDWVEDLMLRTQPPEVYDQWVKNEIPFNDARVVEAIETFGTFAKTEGWAAGGEGAVATVDFRDSPQGLFSVPPQCFMHRMASFIPAFFPEGVELGSDADFFYFPAYLEKDLGRPVLGSGALVTITKDSPAAHALIDYLKTPEAHEIWMARTGFLSPHKGVDVADYANDTLRKQGEILLNATTFRFDGSDLMPGAIGAGAFWTAMVDYVGGKPAADVAADIQAVWDTLE